MTFEPVLLHQDNAQIDRRIKQAKELLIRKANLLNRLIELLTFDNDKPVKLADLERFLDDETPEETLRSEFLKTHALAGSGIKAEKLNELVDFPDYSELLEVHDTLSRILNFDKAKAWFNEGRFTAPLLSKEEKEEIVKEHSIYAISKRDLDIAQALEKFVESYNFFADRGLKIFSNQSSVPHPLLPFVSWTMGPPKKALYPKRISFLVVNYSAFKNGAPKVANELRTTFSV